MIEKEEIRGKARKIMPEFYDDALGVKPISARRVHVDRQGYVDRGRRYFGTGAPLYRVECSEGEIVWVRAESAKEAKMEAERRPYYWGVE